MSKRSQNGSPSTCYTLPPEAWRQPSACDLWEVRDVVGHLTWLAEAFADAIARGLYGDASLLTDRAPGNVPVERAAFSAYLAQNAIACRARLGEHLLPTFSARYGQLSHLLAGLTPQDWDKPCAFWPSTGMGTVPVQAYLLQTMQELVLHGWDIRSRLETAAPLAPESLPLLMARLAARLRGRVYAPFCLDPQHPGPVRYRFALTGAASGTHDLIVENGAVRMEPAGTAPPHATLRGAAASFVLLMYGRVTLEQLLTAGQLVTEGDRGLTTAFDQWLRA